MASNKNKLAFLSMPAPASYVAGLGRGWVLSQLMSHHSREFSVHLVSLPAQISALRGKGPQRKSSRMYSLINAVEF